MTADAVGGIWQYSLDLARALSGLGMETMLAIMGPSPGRAQRRSAAAIEGLRLIETGLPLDWLVRDRAELSRSALEIARLARRSGADIVQLNSPALAAEADFDQPVVATAHSCVTTWWEAVRGGAIDPDLGWQGEATGRGLRAADIVVAPSKAFAQATRAAHRLKALPVVVHNGRAPPASPAVAQSDSVFTAGRLWDKGKNVATLDRAAALLDVPVKAAGACRGPNGEAVTLVHARALGSLSDRQVARRLVARPVFASAALYEPFGLAVLEAAQAGCALVLSDIPTFRELWSGAAAFVDPLDAEGFAETIRLVLTDDFARMQMGKAAKGRAARFTSEATAARMKGIYDDLAERRLASSRPRMVAA